MRPMELIDGLIEWLTPREFAGDIHAKKRVRMFLISHLFGPVISHPITLYLLASDPQPMPHVLVLGISISAFWLFPLALKLFPRKYTALALISVANLNFALLWGSFNYGGTSSPFLMWLLAVPLLGFFYLGSGLVARVAIFAEILIGISVFYGAYLYSGGFPVHIPIEEMVTVGMISALSATVYVYLMASYYASVVDSQSELLKEIDRHRDTMRALTFAKDDAERAKDDAERANGAKSEFLAKMSHELRTPLNAVLGYTEILLEDAELDGNGGQIADLQKINAAGKHLLAMVNDILDISKIEAGKMELNIENVDLDTLVNEVESTARPLAAKNTNAFSVKRDGELGAIRADATKLRQAIFNLLSNASEFTQNGQITLSAKRETRAEGEWISISVTDTGVGISAAQQAALFSNFSQASPAIAAKFGGTGLGLSLSRNLIRLMGGEISVESEVGKGSTFTISLPVSVAHKDGAVAEAVADEKSRRAGYHGMAAGGSASRMERILVVDDDLSYLELAERLLQKEGYSAISTDAPESVLQIARTVKPLAILIDILMPGLNGWDVLDTLKSDPVTATIPVVMVSVLEERQKALDHGAVGSVPKPVDSVKMKQALALIADHREKQSKRAA